MSTRQSKVKIVLIHIYLKKKKKKICFNKPKKIAVQNFLTLWKKIQKYYSSSSLHHPLHQLHLPE